MHAENSSALPDLINVTCLCCVDRFERKQRTLPAAMLPDCAFFPISRFVLTVNTGTPPCCIMLGEAGASSLSQPQHAASRELDQKWYADRSPKSMRFLFSI